MEPYVFWSLGITAAVLVGLGKGGLPILGILSVPIFALTISPVMAAGILLPVYVVSDVFGLIAYRKHFSREVLKIMIPAACLGIFGGWATAHLVSDAFVTLLVGVVGFGFALFFIRRRLLGKAGPVTARKPSVVSGVFWGSLTGFTSFVSHAGGPPWQVYALPLGMNKQVFAGTSTILFAVVNAVKIIPYYALGQLNVDNLQVSMVLILPAVISVFIGVKVVKLLPERLFFGFVLTALFLVSIKLIWDGIFDVWALF